MPNTLYNAINGQEAKDVINLTLREFVDKRIPLLKRGNTFHLFRCRLRLDVHAVPEDVPTPKDVEFTFEKINHKFNKELAPNLSETDIERLKIEFFRRKNNLDELLSLKEEIDSYLEKYMPTLASIDTYIDDKGVPDNLRIRHGLPLHELELDKNLQRRSEMPVSYPKDKGLDYKPVNFDEGFKIE